MANVFLRAPMADLLQPNKIQSMDKEGKALTKPDRSSDSAARSIVTLSIVSRGIYMTLIVQSLLLSFSPPTPSPR